MKRLLIDIWQIFWKYTVISESEKKWKDRILICKCSCGVIKEIRLRHLIAWKIISCWECSEFINKDCKQCWINMYIPFHNRKRIFCSNECKVNSKITRENIKCITCWNELLKNKSRLDKKFCSSSCRSIFTQAINHNLDIEEYKIIRVEINKNLLKQRKSTEYKKTMKIALKRDCYTCTKCWNTAECVHHIKQVKDYPELILDIQNLTSLCNNCHKNEHRKN